MTDAIQNGEVGSSVRAKLNENFADVAALQAAVGRSFDTVAALLADSTLTYTTAPAGSIIEAGGFRYTVAASAATDQHVTTVGGVKLYVQAGANGLDVRAFGAVGDGTADDRPAFVVLNAAGGDAYIPKPPVTYNLSSALSLTSISTEFDASGTWTALTDDGALDWSFGMFRDDGFVPLNRFVGRSFFGEAARHSGNRRGVNGYGDDALSQNIASWIIKASQVVAMSPDITGRVGITGASWVQPGQDAAIGAGVIGISRHDGISGSARGGYFEMITAKTGGLDDADTAVEFQVGNRTGVAPLVSAYSMAGSIVNGLQVSANGQTGYTTGNSDTPYSTPTQPPGAGIDLAGGGSAFYQKWTVGIVFRDGALTRDSNDYGRAIVMARNHKVQWELDVSGPQGEEGAAIWSAVSDVTQRMALAFQNRNVTVFGPAGETVAQFRHNAAGAGTVNNHVFLSGRTGIAPQIIAEGSDTNIGLELISKGTGVQRFRSHDGTGENLRITPPASAPTDYLTIAGTAGLGIATISVAGASTDIDIRMTPKGAGNVRFGTRTASSDVPVTGYIEIKDAGGTVRRLAVVG